MRFINIATEFWVLLVVSRICETQSYEPVAPTVSTQNQFAHEHLLSLFDDEGSIRTDDIEKLYDTKGNRKFVSRSYGSTHDRLKTLMGISVGTNNHSNVYIDGKLLNQDWINQYFSIFEMLNLGTSELPNLTSADFHWQSNTTVKILLMRTMRIEKVDKDALAAFRGTLGVLDLSNSMISVNEVITLMKSLFQDENKTDFGLRILSLAKLGLTTIHYDLLESVQHSLLALSLSGNNFERVNETTEPKPETKSTAFSWDDYWANKHESSYRRNHYRILSGLLSVYNESSGSSWAQFPPMPFLIYLDLKNCKINSIQQGTFHNLGNLKILSLSKNGIFTVVNYAFEGLKNLLHLELSNNNHLLEDRENAELTVNQNAFADLHSLTILNLSNTFLNPSTSKYLRKLPSSLIKLDLHRTKLRALEDGIFEGLNDLQVLNISDNTGLASKVTRESFKGLHMLRELSMSRTSFSDLGVLRDMSRLNYLDLKYNSLHAFANGLESFPLLEHLDVSYNYIGFWSNGREFAKNNRLTGVFLHGNILSLMTRDMLEDFKSLSYMTLANNSFICNCPLNEFMTLYQDVTNKIGKDVPLLIGYERDDVSHNCTDLTLSKTIRFEDTDEYCTNDVMMIWLSAVEHCIYIAILIVICCMSFGTLVYWKWWYIRYVATLLKNATVLSIVNVENCEDRVYVYDIFVSYSDADRRWIFEELLPNIEGPEMNLNICMHERDFQVGVSILENIITGMDQSRTIFLVISSFFIKSQWCQFEMHMAQHRLLETCREELILIFLEEIPRKKRSKILHYLMMVKTYIVWPKDSENHGARQLFWKRLRKAITTKKSKLNSIT